MHLPLIPLSPNIFFLQSIINPLPYISSSSSSYCSFSFFSLSSQTAASYTDRFPLQRRYHGFHCYCFCCHHHRMSRPYNALSYRWSRRHHQLSDYDDDHLDHHPSSVFLSTLLVLRPASAVDSWRQVAARDWSILETFRHNRRDDLVLNRTTDPPEAK